MTAPGRVLATAGHVDHGKSALVRRLTGIEPDRLEEERRRGLTIDLGYAWTTLSGEAEVGFVDVPGHERFVKNMLAGVGPVRLVLFVVAADEGWKPQSEEHLQILDVLGAEAAVVALTKSDLVGGSVIEARRAEVVARLEHTALEGSPVVPCSAVTGDGIDALREALGAMLRAAPAPEAGGRPRLFVDRSFTVRGSGTVVTGTLTGGRLEQEASVELLPSGGRGRVRALQRHGRPVTAVDPVSRVAANLSAVGADDAARGDVLVHPDAWRPVVTFEGSLRAVRGLDEPISSRGDYKVHAGTAERSARIRLLGASEIGPGEEAFVRVALSAPLVLDHGEAFVLRDSGRRRTVGGGRVLDPDPPRRPGRDAGDRLRRRHVERAGLPAVVVSERGWIEARTLGLLTGLDPDAVAGAHRLGAWWISVEALAGLRRSVGAALDAWHRGRPLAAGMPLDELRRSVSGAEASPVEEVLAHLEREGLIERDGTTVRRAGHRVLLGAREPDAARIEAALRANWPLPPTADELGDPALLAAMAELGRVVQVSAQVVLLPEHAAEAERVAMELAGRADGMTASAFRERLGTSRKYAIPILEWLDRRGVTRRDGDLRRLRSTPG